MEFSTFDRDNDASRDYNCAVEHRGANWWAEECRGDNNINGKYYIRGNGNSLGFQLMHWLEFNNRYMPLKSMTLMFRQVD